MDDVRFNTFRRFFLPDGFSSGTGTVIIAVTPGILSMLADTGHHGLNTH
ncbi:MAG: hypothetical protein ACR2PT_16100 [Endozoicomonas sp.]